MVLVDTSVWVRFLGDHEPYSSTLDELLGRDEVMGHQLVYGELLIGDLGGRLKLLTHYSKMAAAPVVVHEEVVAFVRSRKLHGRGVGWVDVQLLASAVVGRLQLWTADPRFAVVASDLGVGFSAG